MVKIDVNLYDIKNVKMVIEMANEKNIIGGNYVKWKG